MKILRTQFPLAAIVLLTCAARAEHWPGWRGPDSNGAAAGENYPTKWSQTEAVLWKVPLPGGSGSTPVVWDQRIFLTCPAGGNNQLLCLDTGGKQQWQLSLGDERRGKHRKGSGANPSPATDGRRVYVYFKSGDLACVDVEGKLLWKKNLQELYGEDTLWWDLGTSPVLTKSLVVVACMQSGPSYLAAFDKVTGKLAWKQDRPTDAPEESAQSYSTPVVIDDGGRETIVVLGADYVTAHDAATGKEIWRAGGLNPTGDPRFRSIASPVVSAGVVVATYGRGDRVTGIRLGGQGDVTGSHVAWTQRKIGADVPTPAAANGRAYVLTDKGLLTCLDAKTGKVLGERRLEKNRNAYSSSPMVAGGRIYVTREDGTSFVLESGSGLQVVSTNSLGEFTLATPVFINGKILVKTFKHLYCIGE